MQVVSQALFGVDQDAAGPPGASRPTGGWQRSGSGTLLTCHSPFVLGPSPGEFAQRKPGQRAIQAGLGVIRLDFEGPLKAAESDLRLTKVTVYQAPIGVGLGAVRSQLASQFAVLEGLVEPAEQTQDVSEVGMGVRVVGSQSQGLTIGGSGLFEAVLAIERYPEIVTDVPGSGLEPGRLPKSGFCFLRLAAVEVREAEIVVAVGHIGVALQQSLQKRRGLAPLA